MAMTGKERFNAVFSKEKPDRVPVMEQTGGMAAYVMGMNFTMMREDIDACVKKKLEFNKLYGIEINVGGFMDSNIGIFGDLPGFAETIALPKDNYSMVKVPYFAEPEDIDTKEMYDPHDRKEAPLFYKHIADKMEMIGKLSKDTFNNAWSGWGPFTMTGLLRGTEQLMMDLMLEPELAEKALEKVMPLTLGVTEVQLSFEGIDGVRIDDPTSSSTVISRETFVEVSAPHVARVAELARSMGKKSLMHACGDTQPILDVVPLAKVDCFHLDQAVPMSEAKKLIDGRIAIAGNINPITQMMGGTPESIMEESRRLLELFPDGGFVLAPGCESPIETPVENLKALFTARDRFGVY